MEICKRGEIVENKAENAISAEGPRLAELIQRKGAAEFMLEIAWIALAAGFLTLAYRWERVVERNIPAYLDAVHVPSITCTEDYIAKERKK